MLGYSYYSRRGYNILVKLVCNATYDLVIEKNGEFKTVNVKKAHKNKSSWCISMTGRNSPAKKRQYADIYLCWISAYNRFVEFPIEAFPTQARSRQRVIPAKLIQRALGKLDPMIS